MSSGTIIETMGIGVDHHREVRGVIMTNESSNEKNTIVQNLLLHRAITPSSGQGDATPGPSGTYNVGCQE